MSSPYVSDKELSKSDPSWQKTFHKPKDDLANYNNEFVKSLESRDEFKSELESDGFENESESINKFGNGLKDDYGFKEVLDYESEFASKLESDKNNSIITNTTSTLTSSEGSIPFISSEIAVMIQLLQVKVRSNLTEEAFYNIIEA
ncbi:13618_t:CDS:2, partial [Cetraspora pellucida]